MARSFDTGSDDLTCEIGDDGVAVITMDRPERRNAFSDGMLAGLAASLDEVETANDVRCVVLTGAGGAFCAGGDVKGFAENDWAGGEGTPWDVGVHEQRLNHRATSGALFSMPKPTLAALPGPAAGAGLSLALACDIRVAVDTAVITTAFARVGLAGDYGGTWFLTHLVGPSKAKELYFLPERMTMDTALDLGLVNKVVGPADYEAEWRDMATRLASGPPIALRYMKENINRSAAGDLATCLELESTHHRHTGQTEDHKEASRAFVEKREPVFKGR
ncbi:MAG: enoyl-CoA hydratase [Actinomycetia bacterium]|nr:enoyl-CoA hydratase [Actinomycetes bacterium]MCP5035187.1 enoyl-CoA hydratase [Actinomycetes bacterium]